VTLDDLFAIGVHASDTSMPATGSRVERLVDVRIQSAGSKRDDTAVRVVRSSPRVTSGHHRGLGGVGTRLGSYVARCVRAPDIASMAPKTERRIASSWILVTLIWAAFSSPAICDEVRP